ncbi:hypothetical protein [Pseudomonas indica]|uniref:Uncharacterized protein n=1 Tax=Pseudomonas indica TaxID=137658 RepID=A0A1G8ZWZ4_9PSED|nr:hypothetical protein [Pseudomonas indica]SDK19521.1 hypothetical protein SAMN05216186_10529 [Pseudomonas indica]
MKEGKEVTRREVLGVIGALGASAAVVGSSAVMASSLSTVDSSDAKSGQGGCSRGLEFPHTASTTVEVVTAQALAALTNNADAMVSTTSSWDQNFVFMKSNANGEIDFFKTLFSLEDIWQFFSANYTRVSNPGGEQRLSELSGTWYDLIDSRYNQFVLPDGPTLTQRGVFLFTTWPDGVAGHFFWAEPTWAQPFDVEAPVELTNKLIAYEEAWRSGDVEARLALIEDVQTRSSARVTDLTGNRRSRFVAETKEELRAAWNLPSAGTVVELERIHHVVSTFYVFAAYKLVLIVDGEKVIRETALLLPLGPNRKFIGEMSYSFESTP